MWDRFIKYDLRITDYDSLTDKEKELCRFIFETERSSKDTIICSRARMIIAGYDVGERVTLDQTEHYYDFVDSSFIDDRISCLWDYENDKSYANPRYNNTLLRKVPDIKHIDDIDCYNEYWLDDEGREKIRTMGEDYYDDFFEDNYLYDKYDENGKLIETQIIPRIKEELRTLENDGCIYKIYSDNTLALSEVTDKNRTSVSIPESIYGMTVTCIKPYAFMESAVSEVVLPDSLKYIEPFAFSECKNINKINFPKSLESLGGSAFYNCVFLDDIVIDCPNLQVPSGPFSKSSAKNVTVNIKRVTDWLYTCFEECESFNIGSNVKEVGMNYVLDNWKNKPSIPENVKVISGIGYNIDIGNLTIPANIEIFGAYREASGSGGCGIDVPADIPLIKNKPTVDSNCIISGWYGTEAHTYALEYNLKFNPLDEILSGDVNNDGEIDINDAVALQKYLLKSGTAGYGSDINRDGRINVFDMILLKKYLLNKK